MKRHGPDSLHSWLVTAGLTFISMVLYSVVRLSGVFFVASMDRFGVGREKASLPYILTDFIQAIFSPLTGFLASKYSARFVMVLGCFLSGVGISSCFLAETIEAVTVCWGVILGVGFGLTVPLLTLVITQHFVEKRAIALGVMYAGCNSGLCLLPSVAEYMIQNYGLSGTFLLIGGIILNCLPVALIILKPNNVSNKATGFNNYGSELGRTKGSEDLNVTERSKDGENFKNTINCEDAQVHPDVVMYNLNNAKRLDGGKTIENVAKAVKQFDEPVLSSPNGTKKDIQIILTLHNDNRIPITSAHTSERSLQLDLHSQDKKPLRAFKVFLEPVYIAILFTEAMFEGSIIAYVTILVDFSKDVGVILSSTKYVILTYAVFSNVGLLSFGWMTDAGHLSLTNFGGLFLSLRCATYVFIAFSNSMPLLLTAVALHGICEGPISNVYPLIIAEYYVSEVHEVALSCRLFLCAPVYLVIPTFIGYFRDSRGSYFYLLLLLSASSFMSAVLCYLIPQLSKCRCGRETSILRNKSNI